MKRLPAVLVLVVLIIVGLAQAQTTQTNLLTEAEALKLASGLRRGMPGKDVQKFFQEHGVKYHELELGDGFDWINSCSITGRLSLVLHFKRKPQSVIGEFNGLLQDASIQSNGIPIVSIKLRKPEPKQ